MRTAATALLALTTSVAGCGPRNVGPVTEPHVSPTVNATGAPASFEEPAPGAVQGMQPMGGMGRMGRMAPLPAEVADPTDPVLKAGKTTFDQVCSACHTLEPPHKLAPPMRMVSMHLRQRFSTEEEGVAHVTSYVPAPDAERSIMPPQIIQRFGLMTAQPLPAEMLESVARYVWSLGEGGPAMGAGQGMGNGQRMRMRRRGGGVW